MSMTKDEFRAANTRGAVAVVRGPIAQAARYDSRRGLIVITLEGGCWMPICVYCLIEGEFGSRRLTQQIGNGKRGCPPKERAAAQRNATSFPNILYVRGASRRLTHYV